ncbi:MAG: SDR family NAD(P)-dependent oxidoreductase, partial [Candidatus Hydrogenedens sp.]|nr:SDR family NAD(P)-dependent oxidoreductase [Candidatus Hydrogenedens sp.]
MLDSLNGMNALITGSALRIGRAIALRLAKEGVNLLLHYNTSEEEVISLAKELKSYSIKTAILKADLINPQSANSLYEQTINIFGEIDILINNASIFPVKLFDSFSYHDLISSINIHSWAPLQLSRRMKKQHKKGVIINFLDSRLWDYDDKHISYYLGKQLLRTLTRMLAMELAPNIRVNAIAPGLILPPPGETEEY